MNTLHVVLILLALLAANLPWFSERLFYLLPLRDKHVGWRLLELVILYFVVGGIALFAESARMGQLAKQNWEFYAITACLFLVFAFPGFVYRYLWRR
jgi:hypothetical protein